MKYFNITTLLFIIIPIELSCINYNTKQIAKDNITIRSINGSSFNSNELETFLKQQIDSLNIPGLSFAYINDDKIVYSKNLGVTNTLTNEPVTDKTLFDAASISKTVFSFFALQMVNQGILNLDTPLYKYLENPDIAYDKRYKKITARMTLSHTSGFPNWRYLTENGYDPAGKLRIEYEPGTKYQYSGEGYQYLAEVIAHLLDTDLNGLQEVIKKQTFDLIEMGESSFIWNDYLEEHRASGHIGGKPNSGYSTNSKDPNFNAAGSLQTNALAYGNFLITLVNEKLITKKLYKEMLSVQSKREETDSRPGVKYGLGVIINETEQGKIYAHSGDNGSATSQFLFSKKFKSGFVFFTNTEFKTKNILNENLNHFLLKKK